MSGSQTSDDTELRSQMASLRRAILQETSRASGEKMARGNTSAQADRGRESAKHTAGGQAPVSGSMREMRVSLKPSDTSMSDRSGDFVEMRERLNAVGTGQHQAKGPNSFAGIMGGDVRLEEAISRINKASNLHRRSESEEIDAVVERYDVEPPIVREGPNSPQRRVAENRIDRRDAYEPEFEERNPSGGRLPPGIGRTTRPPQSANPPRQSGAAPQGQYSHVVRAGVPVPAPVRGYQNQDYQSGYNGQRYDTPAYPRDEEYWHEHGPEGQYADSVNGDPAGYDTSMLSHEASSATAAAFNRLADTIMDRASGGAASMQDTARELLRPMLKSWLDENLPRVVEQLVREEIQRVARRGGK